ncbi:hypothetical protein [Pelagibacterium xiamenense]|uniref:hypothetical protein n=1 Tax=Pelagibacterium xiamenense TaxID=2901140 RepID=UPI001E5FD7A8|nr:hypothetical protein [Pelagibacterium xiamenense]MCD7058652.1 hypothetical protein [Pelagibacterium xiamenense]
MSKANAEKERERVTHMSTGGHLGGTKFGQVPGAASTRSGANPAKPQPSEASAKGASNTKR